MASLKLRAVVIENMRLRAALEAVDAIKTDDPPMGFQDYYDAVTDTVRAALYPEDA